jgi:hypothetical protein
MGRGERGEGGRGRGVYEILSHFYNTLESSVMFFTTYYVEILF